MPTKKGYVWVIPLIHKIDFQLLPIFCLFYLISSLDNSSTDFLTVSGLSSDINADTSQSQWAISVYYLCVIALVLPSLIILRRWRAPFWIGIVIGVWGIISISIAACTDYGGLVTSRLLSSICEAVFFPGAIYYLSFWYTRQEFGKRVAFLIACKCLAEGLGGLFVYGVSHISDKQMHIWQWIFIIQGAPSIILALVASWCLPNDLRTANFLVNQERQIITRRLQDDNITLNYDDWSWDQVGSVFFDLKTYAFIIIYIFAAALLQAVFLLLPVSIKKIDNLSLFDEQLWLLPPYLIAGVVVFILCYSSDRFYNRSYHAILTNIISVTALVVLKCISSDLIYANYITICILLVFTFANTAIVIVWMVNNFDGFTRRAIAIGATISVGTAGSAAGSQIFYDSPNYSGGKSIALAILIMQSILIIILRYCFIRENLRRSKLNTEDRQYQLYKFNGIDFANDRHPDFRYTL